MVFERDGVRPVMTSNYPRMYRDADSPGRQWDGDVRGLGWKRVPSSTVTPALVSLISPAFILPNSNMPANAIFPKTLPLTTAP